MCVFRQIVLHLLSFVSDFTMDDHTRENDDTKPTIANVASSADSEDKHMDSSSAAAAAASAGTSGVSSPNDINELEEKLENFSIDDSHHHQKDDLKKTKSKEPKEKSKGNKSTKSSLLSEPTPKGVAEYIKSGKCKKVIFMVGAGISTSAGIPDFRSPDTGLFSQLEKYNLPYPEAIFEIQFFKNNPKPFFHLARELFPGNFTPTPCHYFMKLLHDKGILLRLYTQNIDSLERIAGVPGDKLVESHGTFHTAHCINKKCKKAYSLEWMKKIVLDRTREDNVARCEECNSFVKPDIIFYGEMLPERFYTLIESDFKQCDLLIIMGTSLSVQPFSNLVDFVGSNVPRLMINLTKPEGGGRGLLSKFISGYGSGIDFDSKKNTRNVFMQSDTDSGCKKLAELCGWSEDLAKLIESGSSTAAKN